GNCRYDAELNEIGKTMKSGNIRNRKTVATYTLSASRRGERPGRRRAAFSSIADRCEADAETPRRRGAPLRAAPPIAPRQTPSREIRAPASRSARRSSARDRRREAPA